MKRRLMTMGFVALAVGAALTQQKKTVPPPPPADNSPSLEVKGPNWLCTNKKQYCGSDLSLLISHFRCSSRPSDLHSADH
jgi:hypothetical protein